MGKFKKIITLLIFVALLFITPMADGQNQISFRQFSVEDGLSQSCVVSIAQDSMGYMWFATQDGLNKYNAKQIIYYPKIFVDITKSSYSKLGKVYNDRQDNLWIIPISGIPEKRRANSDIFIAYPDITNASSIYQDQHMDHWIGTYDQGLYKIENTTGNIISVLKHDIQDIYHVSDGGESHVIVCALGQVIKVNKENLQSEVMPILTNNVQDNVPVGFSYSTIDRRQTIWLGSFGQGLYYNELEDKEFKPFSSFSTDFNNALPDDLNILSLLADTKDRLWIGTYGSGIYLIDFKHKSIKNFRANKYNPKAIHQNDILSLYEDYTGTIWIGTDGGGLSYFDENLNKFNSRTTAEIPTDVDIDYVRSIASDKEGNIWIGTYGKGLTRYNIKSESWKTFTPNNNNTSIKSKRIVSLLSHNGELWIGHQDDGLSILREGNFINFNEKSKIKLTASTIWCIFRDSASRIWLGTRNNGLILFDKNRGMLKQYNASDNQTHSITSNNIRVIREGKDGLLWIGTDGDGVCRFDSESETFTSYKKNEKDHNGLSSDEIKSIYYAHDDVVWIGTNGGGLNAFDIESKTFHHYDVQDGLSNNVIYGILPDSQENLWLSSNRGITKVKYPSNLHSPLAIDNYNMSDGLQSLEFNTGAYFKDHDGLLYFGGLNGMNWIDPENIYTNSVAPKTVIDQIEIFNQNRPLVQGDHFSANENTIAFSFSALHFSEPKNNSFSYRLIGHDEDWIYSGNTNQVRYTNLESGDYTFHVKSANYDGVWNNRPTTYQFKILNPWYLTLLAKVLYVLFILALAYGVYQYLKWRWHIKMQWQIERDEAIRLRKLDDLKSKLYASISHEFRTPLTVIDGMANELEKNPEKEASKKLSLIKKSSKNLLALVNQMLDLSKLQAGKVTANLQQDDLIFFIKYLVEINESFARLQNVGLQFYSEEQEIWTDFDPKKMEQILTNLISNSVKFTPEYGKVLVVAKKITRNNQPLLELLVKDNGIGISSEQLPYIFDRFHQANPIHTDQGTGIGLSLVKELVTIMEGIIKVESELGKGTTVILHFPIRNHAPLMPKPSNYTFEQIVHQDTLPNSEHPLINNELPVLLIIEDNIDVTYYLTTCLQDEYQILSSRNGKEGVEKALEVLPDIIISDVMMPEMDGFEVCKSLKEDERSSHIPIILLTAKATSEDKLAGLTYGADTYLIKPFEKAELLIRLSNLMEIRKTIQKKYASTLVSSQLLPTSIKSKEDSFIGKAEKIILSHLEEEDFSSNELARELHLSRSQAHRKIKALTGMSLAIYIRHIRLQKAKELLGSSELSVAEIAYQVGFKTPVYFSQAFKEAFGESPNATRK